MGSASRAPGLENSGPDIKGQAPEIQVAGLLKHYRQGLLRRTRVEAVKGISFELAKGQVFGLIGPDGAGKTSVLQILAGVLRAQGGKASVSGIDVLSDPEKVKPLLGYMPQGIGLNLYDTLSVAENIEFFRQLRQVPDIHYFENRDRLLEMTRLAPFLDRAAGKLSGGMRQKLALICTLIHLPDILLLDEPTTGVDPISRRDFWAIIHDLVSSRGVTVLMTTAYMDEAERCHQVALMHQGEIIAEGTPEALERGLEGKLLALSGPDPRQLVASLQDMPGVESVAMFGSRVHVLSSGAGEALQQTIEQESAIVIDDIHPVRPQLEDVFVHQLLMGASQPEGGDDLVKTHQKVPEKGVGQTSLAIPRLSHYAGNATELSGTLRVDRLSCRFGDFIAVDNVSFSVKAGEIFGLLGPNGAGKTTLIRLLCGLLSASEGKAQVSGLDINQDRQQLRHSIGYMAQRFSLYQDLSVQGNIDLSAGLYGLSRKQYQARAQALVEQLGLAPYQRRLTASLPLGLRQRLALACALLHEPAALFLDEPTSGVDPLARRQFWDIVHLLTREFGVCVVVSTHYMDEAEHCDRLGLMQAGKLVVSGTPAALATQAQAEHGPMLVVEADDYRGAYDLIRQHIPAAMLFGRRIQWQSTAADVDLPRVRELLLNNSFRADVSVQALSMEDTFISFMKGG